MDVTKFVDFEKLDDEYRLFIESHEKSIISSEEIGESSGFYPEDDNGKVDVSLYFNDGGDINFNLTHFDFKKYMPYTSTNYYFDLAKYYQKKYQIYRG